MADTEIQLCRHSQNTFNLGNINSTSHVKDRETNNRIGPFVSFKMPLKMGPLANIIA